MKLLKKLTISCISVFLCIAMLFPILTVFAQEEVKLYVKDIKLIYADNYLDAQKQVPEGYKFLNGDLNASTGNKGVFVCYSTTTDPDQAITDIKVMHESGGFERTDFRSSLEMAVDGVYALAEEIVVAVNEFAQNYKNGVPSAIYAKNVLNYFEYDENTLLGDYMVSGEGTYKEYGKMILMCHEEILNSILALLTMGVQQKSGENWIDKLADVDPSSFDSSDDVQYRDRAVKIRTALQQFNDVYCYINGYYEETYTYADLTEENDKEFFVQMSENKDMFVLIQGVLQSYPVGVDSSWGEYGATAEDLFTMGLNNTLNIHDSYALLSCLTPGQEIMLRVAGVYNFLISTQNTEEVLDKAIEHIKKEIPEGDRVPIWEGVNLDIFDSEVGLTNEAQRSIATGKQYDLFTQDVDTLKQHYRNIASIITSSISIAACSVLVVKCSLPLLTLAFAKIGMASAAATVSAFAASAVVSSILLGAGITFAVIGIICAIVVVFFLEDIINWLTADTYERTSIPKYMIDEVITQQGIATYTYYKRVENVKTDKELDLDTDDNESGSDVNANKGYRWMALYITDKKSAGNPIEADMLITTNPEAKSGYSSVSMFGKIPAINFNSYADENSAKYTPVYMFFKQEPRKTVESEKIYISAIRIETASHEDVAKKELSDRGYIPLEYNFGTKNDSVTYIGYKLTVNPDDAIRDIRVLYNFNGTGVRYGELNYGSMGKIGNFDIMVSSTSKNPAPPIVSLAVFSGNNKPDPALGYEPVNEFSGGSAQGLGKKRYYLYFLPETTYTKGPDYITGIETDIYYYNGYTKKVGRSWEKFYYSDLDKYGNNYDNYKQFKSEKYGEQFFDFSIQSTFNRYGHKNNWSDSNNVHILSYKYTTTKNPYRALYGIAATTLSGLTEFNDFVNYGGLGYILSPVEISTNSWYYSNTEFPYAVSQNGGNLGSSGKADYSKKGGVFIEWETYHSDYDIMNMDVTQSLLSKDDANAIYVTGYQSDRTPLTVDDIIFSTTLLDQSEIPSNFTAVDSMIGSTSTPTNIAPTSAEVKIGSDSTNYGFSSEDVMFKIFQTPIYAYYRNEKNVNGKVEAQVSMKDGKYISGLFISSREEIRESFLSSNPELCAMDVPVPLVESNLITEGATVTYTVNISSSQVNASYYKTENHIFFGVSRTNDINSAIRDIRLYIAEAGEVPKKTMERQVTYNGVTFPVTYTLISRTSITEQANQSDESCADERQTYIYISTHPALGDPITEVQATSLFGIGDYEPVLTMEGDHYLTAYLKIKDEGGPNINIGSKFLQPHDFWGSGNFLSFRRENAELPYISEIMVAADNDDRDEAVTKLFEAGFYDVIRQDLNEDAGGDYIYIGLKRTNDKNNAIYDVQFTNDQKKPSSQMGDYILVSSIDLNDGACGKYIYMYAKKTPNQDNQSPLTDISFYGKNPQDSTYTEGNVTYHKTVAVNAQGEKQDLNQNCGFWTDYIYLIKHYYIENDSVESDLEGSDSEKSNWPASIIGAGSIAVIIFIFFTAIIVCVFIVKKKQSAHKNNENNEPFIK